MSRRVSHHRVELPDTIRGGVPVGSFEWAGLGALTNWVQGHGKMLIPWCAIGQDVTGGGSVSYHFYVAPSKPAVERIWAVNLRASTATGVSCDVYVNGASGTTVTAYPTSDRDSRGGPVYIRESLSAKTDTAADNTITIEPSGGNVTVESIACYEQTRSELDASTDDYGVDITTLRARAPIFDGSYVSVPAVIDAYDNLDARRAGHFHWSTSTALPIEITSSSAPGDDLFALPVTLTAGQLGYATTTSTVTVAVYAKVNANEAVVRFVSTEGGDTENVTVSGTSFAWHTGTLTVGCEDVSTADGLRAAWTDWEDVTISAYVTTATQLDIAAISIVRTTKPI